MIDLHYGRSSLQLILLNMFSQFGVHLPNDKNKRQSIHKGMGMRYTLGCRQRARPVLGVFLHKLIHLGRLPLVDQDPQSGPAQPPVLHFCRVVVEQAEHFGNAEVLVTVILYLLHHDAQVVVGPLMVDP